MTWIGDIDVIELVGGVGVVTAVAADDRAAT